MRDAAIWCVTGFSGSPEQDWWMRIAALFGYGYATNSKASIHAVGLPALGEGLARRKEEEEEEGGGGEGGDGSGMLPRGSSC